MNQSELPASHLEVGSDFIDRLRALIGEGSMHAFSARCGISDSLLRKYLAGSLPGLDNLIRIAAACGVSVGWLAAGEGEGPAIVRSAGGKLVATMDSSVRQLREREPMAEVYSSAAALVEIPLYRNLLSAGDGELATDDEVIGTRSFNRDWLEREIGASGRDLALGIVRGDSMAPTLHSGDIVLIDKRDTGPLRDDIYAVLIDGEVFVKRLQRGLDGSVDVISDNPRYKMRTFDLRGGINQQEVSILGRIVWWAHTNAN